MGADLAAAADAPRRGVSVVIPNHNHARYLERCVAQHLAQTRPPDEIVIVDDASTDESLDILGRLTSSDPAVRVLRRAERGGPNRAIGEGVAACRYDLIRVSSVDDLIEPSLLERSEAELRRHPTAGLFFCDPGEAIGGTRRRYRLALAESPAYLAPAGAMRLLRRNFFVPSSTALVFRAEALRQVGGFRQPLEWHADWFAKHAILLRFGGCYVPENLVFAWREAGDYSSTRVGGPGEQALLFRWLDVLADEPGADLMDRFRAALLLSEYSFRALYWLARDPRHRRYLSAALVRRVVVQSVWTLVRPVVPLRWRGFVRRRRARRHRP